MIFLKKKVLSTNVLKLYVNRLYYIKTITISKYYNIIILIMIDSKCHIFYSNLK